MPQLATGGDAPAAVRRGAMPGQPCMQSGAKRPSRAWRESRPTTPSRGAPRPEKEAAAQSGYWRRHRLVLSATSSLQTAPACRRRTASAAVRGHGGGSVGEREMAAALRERALSGGLHARGRSRRTARVHESPLGSQASRYLRAKGGRSGRGRDRERERERRGKEGRTCTR